MDQDKVGFEDILSEALGTENVRLETLCVEYYPAPEAVRSGFQAFLDYALAITFPAVNRDNLVNTETGYRQDNWGSISGSKRTFLRQNVETDSGMSRGVFPVI